MNAFPIRALAILAAACAMPAEAIAQSADASGARRYLSAGSELDWIALHAPPAGELLGAIAASEVDRVRDAARGGQVPAQASVEGQPPARRPGDGWAAAPLAGAARGRAPLGVRDGDGRCDCATQVGDEATERVAALFAQATFTAGDEVGRVRLLHLRLRYNDGVVVHLNGREVARRHLARDAAPMATADRASGPEWESFFIPAAGLLRRGENRLAIEVRPSSTSRSPALDLELEARSGARIVRGPDRAVDRPDRRGHLVRH